MTYIKGLIEGPSVVFYETGFVMETGNYAAEVKDGEWKVFDQSGFLIKLENYEAGSLTKTETFKRKEK